MYYYFIMQAFVQNIRSNLNNCKDHWCGWHHGGLAGRKLDALDQRSQNPRRARLVLGWVTASGFNSRCRTFISLCNQPPRST